MSAPQRYRAGAYGAMVADDNGPWVHADAWQPIESAPKDGTRVLTPRGIAWWSSFTGYWNLEGDDDAFTFGGPTHWMPLPEPPR